MDFSSQNSTDVDSVGIGPEVDSSTLEVSEETKYTIETEAQALAVCRTLRDNAEDLVKNQAAITAQLNGQPPRSKKALADLGKNWYPNINSGFLRNEVDRACSQLAHPILTAECLIASELPPGFPQSEKKSAVFREKFTSTFRSWCKFNPWVRQSAREVGAFGVCYQVFLNGSEWRPTFVRQDKGFVPLGTNIMDDIPLFSCDYDYQPHELLEIVKKSVDAGGKFWDKDAVAAAINAAAPKAKDSSDWNRRSYEEMVRSASIGETFEKGYRTVQTWHLWSADPDGTVSHHIMVADSNEQGNTNDGEPGPSRVLFTYREEYEEMEYVVMPWVFNLDDGTINGCWGVGQILFDTSLEYEKARCDFLMALRLASKLQTIVKDGTNPAEAALHVYDSHTMLEGAQFAGNNAAISSDPAPYLAALGAIQQAARERIGDLVPPITPGGDQPSAKHVQVEDQEQTRRAEQRLFNHLIQFARLTNLIAEKLINNTDDDDAVEFKAWLKDENNTARLTDEELELLADSAKLKTILGYTDYAKAKEASFAAAMVQSKNPFWNQRELNRMMGDAALGRAKTDSAMLPADDEMGKAQAERQQQLELSSMMDGMTVKAVASDPHYEHMQVLRPVLEGAIMAVLQGGQPKDEQFARTALAHYTMHYVYGINQKLIPGDGNNEKAFIAKANRALAEKQMPTDGFQDKQDPIEQAQMGMQAGSQVGAPPAQVGQTV